MRLRDVRSSDVEAFVRMECDPAMMAELGGPLPRDQVEVRFATRVRKTQADEYWVSVIVPDAAAPVTPSGRVPETAP